MAGRRKSAQYDAQMWHSIACHRRAYCVTQGLGQTQQLYEGQWQYPAGCDLPEQTRRLAATPSQQHLQVDNLGSAVRLSLSVGRGLRLILCMYLWGYSNDADSATLQPRTPNAQRAASSTARAVVSTMKPLYVNLLMAATRGRRCSCHTAFEASYLTQSRIDGYWMHLRLDLQGMPYKVQCHRVLLCNESLQTYPKAGSLLSVMLCCAL